VQVARSTRDLLNVIDAVTKRGAGFRSLKDTWADTTSPHGRLGRPGRVRASRTNPRSLSNRVTRRTSSASSRPITLASSARSVAVLYLRVSTIDQTTANQERELREIAARMGCEVVKVHKDHGLSGTRGRDHCPRTRKTNP
jgi:hypothetical protein